MNVNKVVKMGILIAALFAIVFLAGCANWNVNTDTSDVNNQVQCRNRGAGYIWVAGTCCLDENSNDKCDEQEKKAPCDDECSISLCKGDNKKTFYDCVKKADGCRKLEPQEMILGQCGVECFSESDCKSDERCNNNKCEADKCGDGVQGTYENCEECPTDFVREDLVCCSKALKQGNCCTNLECKENEVCTNNICTAVPQPEPSPQPTEPEPAPTNETVSNETQGGTA